MTFVLVDATLKKGRNGQGYYYMTDLGRGRLSFWCAGMLQGAFPADGQCPCFCHLPCKAILTRSIERARQLLPVLLVLILLAPTVNGADSEEGTHDVAFRQSVTFKLKGNAEKGYDLKAEYSVRQRYLTEKSLEQDAHYIADASRYDIEKIKAFHNGMRLKKSAISSQFNREGRRYFGDNRMHKIQWPQSLKVGDSVRYNYQADYSGFYPWPLIDIPNLDRILSFEVVFEHPDELTIDFHLYFPADSLKCEINRPDPKSTHLILENIEGLDPLPYYAFNNVRAIITIDAYENGELVSPNTPEKYVEWFGKQTDLTPELDSADLGVLSDELAMTSDDLTRLRLINDFVRERTRYIAEGRSDHAIIPFAPSLTLERGYGDCKDRTALVSALARTAGLDVYMTILSSYPYNDFGRIHPSLYNHVICAFRHSDTLVFFDPTMKYYPFGTVPDKHLGLDVLVQDENQPQALTLNCSYSLPSLEIAVSGDMDSLDRAGARITLRHQLMSDYLYERDRVLSSSFDNRLNYLIAKNLYKVKLSGYEELSVDDTTVVLAAGADLSDFVVRSSTRMYIPRTPFNVADRELLDRADDPLPIHMDESRLFRLTLDLTDSSVVAAADSLVIEGGDDVHFRARMQTTPGGGVEVAYDYRRMPHRFEGSAKTALIDMCRQYLENRSNMFILE